jgi:hypothetical protein
MRLRFAVKALAIAASVALGLAWSTVPAGAVSPVSATVCSGHLKGPIAGSVIVPADRGCVLDHGSIGGSVTVGAGGNFGANYASVLGGITLGAADGLTLVNTVVHGSVRFADNGDFYVVQSVITGSMTGSVAAVGTSTGGGQLLNTTVGGRVDLTGSGIEPVALRSDNIGEGSALRKMDPEVSASTFRRYLVLDHPTIRAGTSIGICGSTVQGDLTIHNATGGVIWLGGGGQGFCAPPTPDTVTGALILDENSTTTYLSVIVTGDVVCHGDDPKPVVEPGASTVRIGGARIDDCAGLPAS